jgi:hypothetical protein
VKRPLNMMLAAWLALGGAAFTVAADAPKAGSKAPTAADYAALAKLPDWSGVWETDWRGQHRGSGPPAPRTQPKLTPEFQAKMSAAPRLPGGAAGSGANCVPPGLPGIMTQPYPIEFLFTPGKIAILIEAYMQFRHVYTDGRPHPEDPDPTYMGHSIGHWEGDTLVVDSVGFNDSIRIAGRYPHSDQLHIVERIRRVDKDWMQIETTFIDPQVLAEPYTTSGWFRHLDDEIREYICLENNHDSVDDTGRPGFSVENQK